MIALAYGGNGNGDNKDDTKVSLSASAEAADTATGGAVTRAVSEAGFKAGAGSKLVIRTGEGTVILLGAGKKVTAGLELKTLVAMRFLRLLRLHSRRQCWRLMISALIRLLRLRLVRISLPTGSAAISPRVIRRTRSSEPDSGFG